MSEKQLKTDWPEGTTSSSQARWGCVSVAILIFVVAAISVLLATASAIGGFGSYHVARLFEFAPTSSIIAGVVFGGIAAGLGAMAGPPAGWLLTFIRHDESKTGVVFTSVVVGLLSPFINSPYLFFSSVVGAIGGGFVFNAYDPFKAAIYVAIGAPLVGFVLGAGAGIPPGVANTA